MVSIPDKSLLTWNAPKTTTLQAKEMAPHCNSTANNPVPEFPAITKCSHPPHTQNYKKKSNYSSICTQTTASQPISLIKLQALRCRSLPFLSQMSRRLTQTLHGLLKLSEKHLTANTHHLKYFIDQYDSRSFISQLQYYILKMFLRRLEIPFIPMNMYGRPLSKGFPISTSSHLSSL